VGGQERGYQSRKYLTLQFHQEHLGLSPTQTNVLQPLMLFLQYADLLNARLLVIDHHH
jgi:hypothetical protein